jgi:hypothetical protein
MGKFIENKLKALLEGFNEYAQEKHGKDGAVGMVVLVAEQIGSAEDQIEWAGRMINMGSTNMRVAAMSQIFLQAERQKAEDGAPAPANEDTPLNVLRAAAEFAAAMAKAGQAEGIDEPTTCEHDVVLPADGCGGKCLACADLKTLKKLS